MSYIVVSNCSHLNVLAFLSQSRASEICKGKPVSCKGLLVTSECKWIARLHPKPGDLPAWCAAGPQGSGLPPRVR